MDNEENRAGNRFLQRIKDIEIRRPAWLTTPILVIAGIAVIIGLVFLGRFIHHSIVSKPSKNNPPTAQNINRPGAGSQPQASKQGSSSNSNPTSTPSTSSQTPTQLTNTGPGDMLAIFSSASLGAAALHRAVRVRRTRS